MAADPIIEEKESGPTPWTQLNFKSDPRNFHFAIVADRSYKPRPGVFEDAVRKLNLLQPQFVMSVGDLIEGETFDPARLEQEWDEFEAIVRQLEMPFFFVPGGHDDSNGKMADEWRKRFGRAYYHFVYREVLFLCLNTADGREGFIGPRQIRYFEDVLNRYKNVRWTFLFMHEPQWVKEVFPYDTGWEKIEALLADRPYTVFAGHFHNYMKFERNGRKYFTLSVTGGLKGKKGPAFGQFDQIVWVTMADDGPRIANLDLAGIFDENVYTAKQAMPITKLLTHPPVKAAPLFAEGNSFKTGRTKLLVSNPAPAPMTFTGTFLPHEVLQPTPGKIEFKVSPLGSKIIDMTLQAKEPINASGIAPLTMTWQIAYAIPGTKPFEYDGKHQIVIRAMYDCPRLRTGVVIDGSLDEWKELPYVCRTPGQLLPTQKVWQGPEDSWFRFAAAYDDAFVYVAVEAFDDRLLIDPQRPRLTQDGVEICLDARPMSQWLFASAEEARARFLFIGISPGETSDQTVLYDRDKLPKGVQAAAVKTGQGHITELAIPVDYLNAEQGGAWKLFRLNVTVTDSDHPEAGTFQISWQKEWRLPTAELGAGTFRKR